MKEEECRGLWSVMHHAAFGHHGCMEEGRKIMI